jgi:hypothetical protein
MGGNMIEIKEIELKDTVENMLSDSYKNRFIAEYQQLDIRLKKLSEFLDKYAADELDFTPSCPYEILLRQKFVMKMYKDILEQRALIEGISLP